MYPQNALRDLSFDRRTDALRASAGRDLQVDRNGGAGIYEDAVRIPEKRPALRMVLEHLPYTRARGPAQKVAAEGSDGGLRTGHRPRSVGEVLPAKRGGGLRASFPLRFAFASWIPGAESAGTVPDRTFKKVEVK